ncbi:MAG: hypothetical protein WC733_03730 [Methylophilus sp.]|jgi:hypothetical protein
MIKNALLTALIISCLSACGEISYKMGGSARDVENAHASCRGVAEAELNQCLEKQGWKVQKFDDMDLFAVASVSDNRAQVKPSSTTESVTQTAKTEYEENAKSEPAKVAQKPEPAIPHEDPMQLYKINSWWKFGASDKSLMTDSNACTATLGDAHKPDMSNQTYTRSFVICMHNKGWQALKAIK